MLLLKQWQDQLVITLKTGACLTLRARIFDQARPEAAARRLQNPRGIPLPRAKVSELEVAAGPPVVSTDPFRLIPRWWVGADGCRAVEEDVAGRAEGPGNPRFPCCSFQSAKGNLTAPRAAVANADNRAAYLLVL